MTAYLQRRCPSSLFLETRSGHKIYLNGDTDDLVTVLAVFGRKEYGEISHSGVIIDIGAHLGTFSIYAALHNARNVYCYEPDPKLYRTLLSNVGENSFSAEIVPRQAAVMGTSSGTTMFYPESNASGHVEKRDYDQDTQGVTVDAVTLAQILRENDIQQVDLLKLDCEGSEYGIVFETSPDIWSRIKAVRLEYHRGNSDALVRAFCSLGFRVVRHRPRTSNTGILWVDSF
jgi:FkbM family methyltransferase